MKLALLSSIGSCSTVIEYNLQTTCLILSRILMTFTKSKSHDNVLVSSILTFSVWIIFP